MVKATRRYFFAARNEKTPDGYVIQFVNMPDLTAKAPLIKKPSTTPTAYWPTFCWACRKKIRAFISLHADLFAR